jgi:hypothetical protein
MTGYPAAAIKPIFDQEGREFVAKLPMPGHPVMNVALIVWEMLALAHLWANEATEAAQSGNADKWRFAEERWRLYLQLAQQLDPTLSERLTESLQGPMGSA